MQTINRRKALATVAAAPAAVALSAVPAQSGPSELAALIRRYFAETDAFNKVAAMDGRTDEDNDAHAAATYEVTLEQIIRTPARTQEDALAVIEFMEREELIERYWDCGAENVPSSLVAALRGYIEGRVA